MSNEKKNVVHTAHIEMELSDSSKGSCKAFREHMENFMGDASIPARIAGNYNLYGFECESPGVYSMYADAPSEDNLRWQVEQVMKEAKLAGPLHVFYASLKAELGVIEWVKELPPTEDDAQP